MQDMIKFTPERLVAYRAAYQKAVDEGVESFVFEGDEWITSFAKYMIEFLGMHEQWEVTDEELHSEARDTGT